MTVGSMCQVYRGNADRTEGGLTKKDIIRVKDSNGNYRYKSRKKRKSGKENPWILSVKKARKQLGVNGFVPMKKSSKLYKLAKKIYNDEWE